MSGMLFEKPESRTAEKAARLARKERERREAYRLVERRDGYRCRSCGERWTSGEGHHHLKFRSGGGADTTANLLLLCQRCHADVHAYRLTLVGTNANRSLRFERR